jgi:hypothetical protein
VGRRLRPDADAEVDVVHDDDMKRSEGDSPSLRQRLHAATGDRDAEAAAVADRRDDVSEEDARQAVRRAHGDVAEEGYTPDADLATTEDAELVHEEREAPERRP